MRMSVLLQGVCLACLVAAPALAKVSAQEAAELGGPKLTAFGAEKAGNADGSIPAYSGPLTAGQAGVSVPTGGMPPDPFSGDKVLYTVSAANLGQYAGIVTPGTAEILKKYPDFHLNVYQTRRTAGYPQWVLDNTRKNATTAEVVGPIAGDGVTGAYGGIPFPIPKTGYEALWDVYLSWNGVAVDATNGGGYFVDSSGNATLTNRTNSQTTYNFYNPDGTALTVPYYYQTLATMTAPAGEDGQKVVENLPINYGNNDQQTYVYTIGQRRVRLAPEYKYDTPIGANGGAFNYDETNIYSGRPDRFDFKLVGKKEMLIPYNTYKPLQPSATTSSWLTPKHPNPDLIRWEKHRVWVVEATLKPGQRHVYSRRTFYIDEDTWSFSSADAYDQGGQLYRTSYSLPFAVYNAAYPVSYAGSLLFFNLNRGSYATSQSFGGPNNGSVRYLNKEFSPSLYTPENMAGTGIR